MENRIGDESIYLRLQQLQKGLLQFTDTTNAYRLLTEYGKDIRYNSLCIACFSISRRSLISDVLSSSS